MRNLLVTTAVAVGVSIVGHSGLVAQEAAHPHKYAVAVVSVEELPHLNGAYEVVRRPDRSPVEVIYLKKGAGAGVLSQAVLTVMAARERSGLVPPEKEILRVSPKGMGRQLAGEVPWGWPRSGGSRTRPNGSH